MRAVVFDLDGTLLNAEHQLGEENRALVKSLGEAGVRVFLATGRTHLSMSPYYRELNLDTPQICYNGAKIVYPDGRVHESRISPEVVSTLIDLSRAERVQLNLYHDDHWYTERPESQEALRYARTAGLSPVSEGFESLRELGATKALLIASPERLEALLSPLNSALGEGVSLTSSMPTFLEVLQRGVNKAEALRSILTEYEIELRDVIAFGDGLNDREMIEAVGHGVAMQNARPQLIAVADAVAPHHHPDGVTQYLQEYAPALFT